MALSQNLLFICLFLSYAVTESGSTKTEMGKLCGWVFKPLRNLCSTFLEDGFVPEDEDPIEGKVLRPNFEALARKAKVGKECKLKHCSVCLDSMETCFTCKRGYCVQFDSNTETSSCVKNCFMGYEPSKDIYGNVVCKRPGTDCSLRNCMKCQNEEACATCRRGYRIQFNNDAERFICVKKCFMGYIPGVDSRGNAICVRNNMIGLGIGCLDRGCSRCKRGYYLLTRNNANKTCTRICPTEYRKDRVMGKCIMKSQ